MISALIIILGSIYLIMGLWGISVLHPPFIDLNLGLLITSIFLSLFGVISVVAGTGIWKKREWARRTWLSLSLVLVAFHSLWLVKNIPLGIGISDFTELCHGAE